MTPVEIVARGLLLIGATAVVVAPILHLAAPVLTPTGPKPRVVALANRAYRRAVPRSHPADSYPEPDPDAGVEA